MKRLNKKAGVQPIKEFIDKYYQNSGESNFLEFRKAFVEQYKDEIKKYPLLEMEMTDYGYEGGNGIALLDDIYGGDLVFELNGTGSMDQDEIYENLIENYLHDFWIEIPGLYKTEL
jgi:hypothetical protein